MERFTTGDGVTIAYRVWDDGAGGPPVVLQHGFAADTTANWVRPGIVDALRRAGRTVVSVDARGHGASGKPTEASLYGEARMARDLAELLDARGVGEVDLVGYSMGAVVALLAASSDDQGPPGGRVRRLVVGGVGAGVVELGGVDTRVLDNRLLAVALRASGPGAVTDPVSRGFRAFAEATGADLPALAAQAEAVHASPIPLDRIGAPTLVLAGDADPLAQRPQVLADAIPGARLVMVTGDHLGAVGDPALTTALVDFVCTGTTGEQDPTSRARTE